MDNDRYFNRSLFKSYIRLLLVAQRLLTCNLTVFREEHFIIKWSQKLGSQSSLISLQMLTVRLRSVNDVFSRKSSDFSSSYQLSCHSRPL